MPEQSKLKTVERESVSLDCVYLTPTMLSLFHLLSGSNTSLENHTAAALLPNSRECSAMTHVL